MALKLNHLLEVLDFRAQSQPNAIAYRFVAEGGHLEDLNYAELAQKAKALASLIQKEVPLKEKVLISLDSSLEYLIGFFACIYAGVIPVTGFPPQRQRHLYRLEWMIKDSGAVGVITSSEILSKAVLESSLINSMKHITVDHIDLAQIDSWNPSSVSPDDLAFLQYTSGSTSNPKGVMVSHRNLISNFELMVKLVGIKHFEKLVTWLPIFHDLGLIGCLLSMFYLGKPAVFMAPLRFLKNPMSWLKTISDEKATMTMAPNFAYDLVSKAATEANLAGLDLSSLSCAVNGAEPIRMKTLRQFQQVFEKVGLKPNVLKPAYGMAEATLAVSYEMQPDRTVKRLSKQNFINHKVVPAQPDEELVELVSCGKTCNPHQIIVVNPNDQTECPSNMIGEIWFSGPSVTQGYFHNIEATSEIFVKNPSFSARKKFLRTGDLGFIDEEGRLYVTGRLKDLIIIHGKNIYPQDLEILACESHLAIISNGAAAFAIVEDEQERLVIAVEIQAEFHHYPEIYQSIRESVWNAYEVAVYEIILIKQNTLPKTSSGKLQRRLCREHYLQNQFQLLARESESPHLQSHTTLEEHSKINYPIIQSHLDWMAQWLLQRKKRPILNIHEKTAWNELELDSVIAIELMNDLGDRIQQLVSPALIWEHPTPYLLLKHLLYPSRLAEPRFKLNAPTAVPIAVIGMSACLPGSPDIASFWQNILNSKNVITQIPNQRKKRLKELGIEVPKQHYAGYLSSDIEKFDARFFHISPLEADYLDPQQRLALEQAWLALEDAGINPHTLMGSDTGVYLGISSHDYDSLISRFSSEADESLYRITGNSASTAAGRISYFLGLNGPCKAIDTACSSSLVALHDACIALQLEECSLALVGGVNILLNPEISTIFTKAHMLSPFYACKTFDDDADGYVRGEGCGWLVLKRLDDAIHDQDSILAVIRGSAMNQDGKSQDFTAPNGQAQIDVMHKALKRAGLHPNQIYHVEAHGTGTPLGDPIEWDSIAKVYGQADRQSPLVVSSIKTHIGHLEAAAGMAGVIKTILALKNRLIPPHLHYEKHNRHCVKIPNMVVPTCAWPWENHENAHYAAVSSFGLSGTNAHVILSDMTVNSELKINDHTELDENGIWVISANSYKSCKKLIKAHYDVLLNLAENEFLNYCGLTNCQRDSHLPYRAAVTAKTKKEWLKQYYQNQFDIHEVEQTPEIIFCFAGQGCQMPGMGQILYQKFELFRHIIDECEIYALNEGNLSIKKYLCLAQNYSDERQAQIALVVFEYALAMLWTSWNIRPHVLIGHSLGEYAMAAFAGVFHIKDAIKLLMARIKALSMLSTKMTMVVFNASAEIMSQLIRPYSSLYVALQNADNQTVVAGDYFQLEVLMEKCKLNNLHFKKLSADCAYHTPMMQAALVPFEKALNQVSFAVPRYKCLSTIQADWCDQQTLGQASYWLNHLIKPVQFRQSLNLLIQDKPQIFLDIAAKSVMLVMLKPHQYFNETWHSVLTSMNCEEENVEATLETLKQLFIKGFNPSWNQINKINHRETKVAQYPFDRKAYWFDHHKADHLRPLTPLMDKSADTVLKPAKPAEHQDVTYPSMSLEQYIIDKFSELLKIEKGLVKPHSNWFDFGLNSMVALHLAQEINQYLNSENKISASDFYEYQTVQALCEFLEENKKKIELNKSASEERELNINQQEQTLTSIMPLNVSQNNLWQLVRNARTNPAYVLYYLRIFQAEPHMEKLEFAFKKILEVNPILSTRFKIFHNQIISYVETPKKVTIQKHEFNASKKQIHILYQEIYKFLENQVFDLEKDLLIRLYVVKLNDNQTGLVVIVHHMICDGVSILKIMQQIENYYQVQEDDLARIDRSFSQEYQIAFEQQSARLVRFKNYYSSLLDSQYLSSPFKINQAASSKMKNKIFKIDLDKQQFEAIKIYCQDMRISAYSFFMSMYVLILAQLLNQPEVYLYAVNSGRQYPFVKDTIGFFAGGFPMLLKQNMPNQSHSEYVQKELINALQQDITGISIYHLHQINYIHPKFVFNYYPQDYPSEIFTNESTDVLADAVCFISDVPNWDPYHPEHLYFIVREFQDKFSALLIIHSEIDYFNIYKKFEKLFHNNITKVISI